MPMQRDSKSHNLESAAENRSGCMIARVTPSKYGVQTAEREKISQGKSDLVEMTYLSFF